MFFKTLWVRKSEEILNLERERKEWTIKRVRNDPLVDLSINWEFTTTHIMNKFFD